MDDTIMPFGKNKDSDSYVLTREQHKEFQSGLKRWLSTRYDIYDNELDVAYYKGYFANLEFQPATDEEKKQFETGLQDFVSKRSFDIDASEISDSDTLKGFVYTLVSMEWINSAEEVYSPVEAEIKIYEELKSYDEKISSSSLPDIIKEAKQNFELGITLAAELISARYDEVREAYSVYGIKSEELSASEKKVYLHALVELKEDINSHSINTQSPDEFFDLGFEIYDSKIRELNAFLTLGNHNLAQRALDYLDLLIKRYQKYGDGKKRNLLQSDDDVESVASMIGNIDELIETYDIEGKIGKIRDHRLELYKRKKFPIYELEQRIKWCTKIEAYEKAAELRDELADMDAK